jgi:hypothetical protein
LKFTEVASRVFVDRETVNRSFENRIQDSLSLIEAKYQGTASILQVTVIEMALFGD